MQLLLLLTLALCLWHVTSCIPCGLLSVCQQWWPYPSLISSLPSIALGFGGLSHIMCS